MLSRSHTLRLQKILEVANTKLDSVITDLVGKSGRAMIEAMIAGEINPAKLAALADPRIKASPEQLREALRGRVTDHHRFMLRLHLDQIDAANATIASLLTTIYHMLKDGTQFQDLGADHFDRRSKEVRANRLVTRLANLGFEAKLTPLAVAA